MPVSAAVKGPSSSEPEKSSLGSKLDILCFGEPLFEFNERDDGTFETGFGGDVSNCAIAAARCGAVAGMLAHIGADRFGDSIMQLWQSEGIRTDAVVQQQAHDTGVYFVTHDEHGHDFSYIRRHSAATQIHPDDINAALIENAKVLHVSGISQAISKSAASTVVHAIEVAKDKGTLVSYDTNLRLKLWPLAEARSVIHDVIGLCDIVLPGLDDAFQLTGKEHPDAIVDFYLQKGSSVVALTMGADGVLVATQDQRETLPSYPVNAIDCNAAGDTFDGAFLSVYTQSGDPFAAARYANAAAALSTTRSGAVRSIPNVSEIASFLDHVGSST